MFQFLKFHSTTIFLVKALGVVSWLTFAVFPDDVMMMMFLCLVKNDGWCTQTTDSSRFQRIPSVSSSRTPTHSQHARLELNNTPNPQIHKVSTSSEMSLIMNLLGALLLLRMSLPDGSNCLYTCRFPLTLTTLFLNESIFSQINSSITYTVFGD